MEAVGSKHVQCYYDFRNTADAGHDTVKQFRQLGRQHVCELHMKENGFLLANGPLEWTKVRDTIYETGFSGDGWVQIEGALPKDADLVKSYQNNLSFLRSCLKLINGIAFKTKDAHRYTDEVIATQQWRHKKPMLVP